MSGHRHTMTVTLIRRNYRHQRPAYPRPLVRIYSSPTRAMRYYRVWIYTCNAVLFVCVIGFVIVAAKVIVADPRRSLIPEFTLAHPSLLYVYFALVAQSGFVQLVGCLGARNLNEKLLNMYWLLLLLLLVGDVLLGLFWVYHFDYIVNHMQPTLKHRFRTEYGSDAEFTKLWDMVQRDDQCCGVHDYKDYYQNDTFPDWVTPSSTEATYFQYCMLPPSCCGGMTVQMTTMKPPEARRNVIFSSTTAASTSTLPPLPPIFSTAETVPVTDVMITNGIRYHCSSKVEQFYMVGCEKRLINWFRSSLDILFILGYCVISFIKMCFLGILRYEIREMIQKIKILQTEEQNNAEIQDISGMPKVQQVRRYDHNGSVVGVAQQRNSKDSILAVDMENTDAELVSPLLPSDLDQRHSTPAHLADRRFSDAGRRTFESHEMRDLSEDRPPKAKNRHKI